MAENSDIFGDAKNSFKKDYDKLTSCDQYTQKNIHFSISTNYEGEINEVNLSINWCLLSKASSGRKNKPLLFFFHGIGCSKSDIAQAIDFQLLHDVDIIGFDLPGCGDSSFKPHDEWSYEAFSDLDTLVKIAHKTINTILFTNFPSHQKYLVMGHSMGGITAIMYTRKYLNEVSGCYLVDCDVDPTDIIYPESILKHNEDDFCNTGLFKELHKNFLLFKNPGWTRYVGCLQSDLFANSFLDRTRVYYKHMKAISHVLEMKIDLIGHFKDILEHQIPVMYVCGSENTSLKSYGLLCELRNDYNTLTVDTISKSNHFPFIDNPNEFYKKLHDFILKYFCS